MIRDAAGEQESASQCARPIQGIVTRLSACDLSRVWLASSMQKISYDGYRFPPAIIRQAIWLYLRFTELARCRGFARRARNHRLVTSAVHGG
jgi:hypothetical protein